MSQPPVCGDCDKEIPMSRYQLGLCVECEKERAMSDPNWHRSTENWDPATPCRCGHRLDEHEAYDRAPCGDELCDCEGFDDNYEPPDDENAWSGGFAENH